MRLLLDTHIFYWTLYERTRQPALAVKLILDADAVFVSAASLWEIAIKIRIGKLKGDIDQMIENLEPAGFFELPVSKHHAAQVAKLPLHHSDPFDRMLVAQAISEPMYLLTVDSQLPQYSNLIIRV